MKHKGHLTKVNDNGEIDPHQAWLVNNMILMSDDGFKTSRSALGEITIDGQTYYGLIAEMMLAGYIEGSTVKGSTIIGGEIYSTNYNKGTDGTYIDLVNGDFELGSGKICYDSENKSLTLKDVTVEWGSVNKPSTSNIEGLDNYLDQLDGRVQSYSQTEDPSLSWDEDDYVNNEGDLWFNPDDGLTKMWNGSSWDVINDSELKELAQSKAQVFTDTPTIPYYIGDLWMQGSTGDIMHCINTRISGEYVDSDWIISSKYTDDTVAKDALEKAKQGLIDSAKYTDTEISKFDGYVAKYLGLGGNTIIGENYVVSPLIEGGYLNITNTSNQSKVIIDPNNKTGNGYIFQVHNGKEITVGINSNGDATFKGAIHATSLTLDESIKIGTGSINGLSNVATSGKYTDLSGQPTIPSKVSQLTNDSGYQNETGVVTIAKGAITADYIKTLNLQVGNQITMGSDAKIAWSQVTGTSDIATKTYVTGLGYQTSSQVTQITKNTITTTYVNALNITAGSVAAENITGTTISGKTISGGSIVGSSINIGNGNFVVDTNGKMTAKSGTFSGSLDAASGTFKGSLSAAGGTFAGTLSAVNGSFTSLTAGNSYFCPTYIIIDADGRGSVRIGTPDYSDWDEITIRPIVPSDMQFGTSVGNLGTDDHPWDILCIREIRYESTRDIKEDINIYDTELAYEELKNMPIYTYFYKNRPSATKNMAIGTMIDYVPTEAMLTTPSDSLSYNPMSMIFWNIAASQVMQSKLENLISRVNELEEKLVEG